MIWTLTMNPALDLAVTTPKLEIRRKLRCKEARITPGGGGINCSRAIANLGGESCALFTCGGDAGEIIERRLNGEGIRTQCVDVAGATRINVLANPEGEEGAYRLVLPGPELSEREWRGALHALEQVLAGDTLLIASGSLPPGVPDDFYARVAAIARRRGAPLLLDGPPEAMRQALERERLYAIKPNRAEWMAIRHCEDDREALIAEAEALVRDKRRAEVVLVSLGSQGALCVTRQGSDYIRAPEVEVVDTTGAGDSMLGAFALALVDRQQPLDAARYAVAAGAATVGEYGSALCRPDRLAELLERIGGD